MIRETMFLDGQSARRERETMMREFFERRTRDNGDPYYTLKDDAPDRLRDAVRDAHDDELPNDWRYETLMYTAAAIDDAGATDAGAIADLLVDTYTSDLLDWLRDNPERNAYVDEARDDGMIESNADIETQIRIGQYLAIERMAQIMLDAAANNAEDDES